MSSTPTMTAGAAVRPKVPPPLVYAMLLAAALTLHWWVVPGDLPGGKIITVTGAVLTVAGLALSLTAAATVLRQGTTLVPHHPVTHLVTTGPFRITRNPMYTGLTVGFLVGPALWIGTWWPLVLVPICVVAILRLVIMPEEAYLAEHFGDDYVRYRSTVRRWL